MSVLTFSLFKLNTPHKESLTNRQILSQPRPRYNDDGVLNLHQDNDVKKVVSSQPSITCIISQSENRNSYIV